jgi:hypothetical protein
MNKAKSMNIGDRVRVKSTGQEVTIDQISQHGFTVIKFRSGGKHRFLNNMLEPIMENRTPLRLN